ncbi:uncharacterized protein BX664DRAFT_377523 [Halteromyces radiatus]|uniref:uncharacterized protein n=1 Tax=Halteromyces radiatus TaxID=101107 RepID=UPI00221E6284|nr:uncharacterized protein BX664DRAFT_377523 [Halteromyces radiatus]KAI8099833.1 hypothetical protein BX664DRAFT_377523 [Halteromyces radiatus]
MDFLRQLPTHVYITGSLAFLVWFRNYGGYRYRCLMAILSLILMATFGVIASLILPIFGQAGLINYLVARGYHYIGGFFTGLRTTIIGQENILQSPAVYVCNHQTSLDIMVMGSMYPKNTSVVAKKELKYYPFLGWFMTLSNAIFLDRKNRTNALKEARQAAEDIHKKKISVWLFPEGTRGHSSKVDLLPFKKGAFHMAVQARVPIVPVVIANYNDIYSTKAKRFLPGNVNIKVLPPVVTNDIDEDSASIEKLSIRVRESMLTALREISPTTKEE